MFTILDEDGNDVGQNNLSYDELNVSDLEGYHHSYNQNKGLNMDSGLLQNPEGNSTIGAQFADGGFETTQIVRGTFGLGGAETDESVNRDVHNVMTTETKELGGTNFDGGVNTEWVTGGERQKRNEDGSLKYDHLGRPVMEDVNGLEAIASDITSVANVHRDLYSGARDFNRLVGAQIRDVQDMLRPEPSEAEQSMLELDISHVEEEILAIGFDRRGNDEDMAIGPSRAITHPEIFFDDAATNEAMGDYVQSMSETKLGVIGVIGGTGAIIFSGGTATVFAGIGYAAVDYKRGDASNTELTTSILIEGSSRAPYAGPLIEGGSLIYTTVKEKYEDEFK